MNNVHPIFCEALAPFVPRAFCNSEPVKTKASPALRPFDVTLRFDGKVKTIPVLAFTSCDAIYSVIDAYFDGDEPMPADGLDIRAIPANVLKAA